MTVLPCVFHEKEFVVEPDDFPTMHAYRKHVTECKVLCDDCPIKAECLKDALKANVKGVWGGTSWQERNLLRTAMGIEAEPVMARLPQDFVYEVA